MLEMDRLTYKDATGKWVINSCAFYRPERGLPMHLCGEAVERLAKYENLGTLERVETALEKQIAKPVMIHVDSGTDKYICPNCGRLYFGKYNIGNCCVSCGQRLRNGGKLKW